MKKTGGDYFTLAEIRTMLREANEHYDGPGEVALVLVEKELEVEDEHKPKLECVGLQNAVVEIPGDGRPFPERAFAEALRVAPVITERK